MLIKTPIGNLGWKMKKFTLKDFDGKSYSLEELMGEKGLLIAFICNHCPYVQTFIQKFVTDAKELQKTGINVVAINSNDYESVPSDAPPMMSKFSRQNGFSFPYLVDEDQSVGKDYGAVCTPDFFGFNAKEELQYRGRLDDTRMENKKRIPELVDAMKCIAETGIGPIQQHPSMGCSIKWK